MKLVPNVKTITIGLSLFFNSMISIADSNATLEKVDVQNKEQTLTLKQIMAAPDWMGNAPQNPLWSYDSQSVIFGRKMSGHTHLQQFQVDLQTRKIAPLADDKELWIASQSANRNNNETQGVFIFQGDVYWTNYATGEIKPLLVDEKPQSFAQFIDQNRISYQEGYSVYIYHLDSGYSEQIVDFKLMRDPEEKEEESYLVQSQPRLLKYLEQTKNETAFQKKRKEANRLSKNKIWYLGKGVDIRTFRVSPDASWLLLGTVPKTKRGKADRMPEFVTEDGYVNDRKVRPLVGTSTPTNETFYLVDLNGHKKHQLDTSHLPGVNDDPLDDLKRSAAKKIGYKYEKQQGSRPIYAHDWNANGGVEWSKNSQKVALLLYSYDNKDRWIVGLDVDKPKLKTFHWLSDDAWINDWTFNQFGWLPDNETLYYLSEEEGYSHLYIKKGKRRARQMTDGEYEVSDVTVTKNGDNLFFKANKKHPGIYEIYQLSLKSREITAVTNLGGVNDYVLSPDQQQLIIRHSTTTQQPELYHTLLATTGATPTQLTDSSSAAFKAINWQKPDIVEVPSTHIDRAIYSRHYTTTNQSKLGENGKKPAVIFVHGAGYLQNSHQGWSNYFREFMFHNLLTQQGYEVLDMDYRASKGYGRDWRTAIYRNMGTPELEDLTDGAKWLVDNANVDPERIGIYGGSYGGFMTFMALFKAPEVFAAGAALRPVTDWAHYNHGYTSNILNTPQVDPEAFEKSSPIEFAEGLNKPLLICHGMVDDNVFFKDSVRLVQRLIELEKTPYFETAIYPVEPHGFVQPSSWLDEYTRIYQLFEKNLN